MVEWEFKDADLWKTYLESTDRKLLDKIKEFLPKVTGKDFQDAALQGRERQGAENILEALENLTNVQRNIQPDSLNVDITKGLP